MGEYNNCRNYFGFKFWVDTDDNDALYKYQVYYYFPAVCLLSPWYLTLHVPHETVCPKVVCVQISAASLPRRSSTTFLNFSSSSAFMGYVCSPSTGNEPFLTSSTYCRMAAVDRSPIDSYTLTNLH